jgi:hypothetical protein
MPLSESLAELANRSLLFQTSGTTFGGTSEIFILTQAFHDLIDNAKSKFERVAPNASKP